MDFGLFGPIENLPSLAEDFSPGWIEYSQADREKHCEAKDGGEAKTPKESRRWIG